MPKKSITLILSILLLITTLPSRLPSTMSLTATENDIVYAYLKENATLHTKTAAPQGGDAFLPLTTLPKTYFVALLQNLSEATDGYIRVSYLDITGYLPTSEIEIVDYEPVTKYATPTLILYFDGMDINLRSTPDHNSQTNILTKIPSSTSIPYYGTTQGTAMFEQTGTTWYYVRYSYASSTHYGYVYSAQATAQPIPDNIIEKVPKQTQESPNSESPNQKLNLSDPKKTVLIICLCIPAVLIMLVLFQKPQKKSRQPRQ